MANAHAENDTELIGAKEWPTLHWQSATVKGRAELAKKTWGLQCLRTRYSQLCPMKEDS